MYNYFIITYEDMRTQTTTIEGYGSYASIYIAWLECTKYAIQKAQGKNKYTVIKSIEQYTRGI